MNGMATSGKNFQTVFAVAEVKGAYEMGLFSPAAPDQQHHALFSSLAARQRVHVLPLQPAGSSRPARNYGGRKLRYTHENPGDERPNTHVLVHVPAHLMRAFKAKAGDWFDALDGGVKVDPRNDAQRRAKGLGTRLGYMCKGADALTCRRYGGHRAKGGQGPISIKRAGVAQLLSKQFSDTKTARNCGVIKRGEAA